MSKTTKTFLKQGKLSKVSDDTKADYKFISPTSFFSPTTNLIPQLSGVSGSRVLLGDKATLQSVSLVDRQEPLVQSQDNNTNESFIKTFARPMAAVFSKSKGKVKQITNEHIIVADGKKEVSHPIYDNYLTGQKSFIHHTPVVKEGDTVDHDQLLAKSNFTDDKGNLALGTNLTTAVMPYRSKNFEDAYVLTEAGARKLVGEQMIPLTVEKERGLEIDKDKFISLFPNKYYNAQLANIDDDGVVKKGTKVHHGDPLILSFEPRTLKTTDAQLGNLSSILKNAFSDRSNKWDYESPGEIIDVAKTNKSVTITIKTQRPMVVGDKLCLTPDHDVLTKLGWKNISQVIPDDEIASLNSATGEIEFCRGIPCVFEHTGELYNVENKLVSTCVTLNHKLYASLRLSDRKTYLDYALYDAAHLINKTYKLKLGGSWTNGISPSSVTIEGAEIKIRKNNGKNIYHQPNITLPTNIYMAMLGQYLSEGSTVWAEDHHQYTTNIWQYKQPCLEKLITFAKEAQLSYCLLKEKESIVRGVCYFGKSLAAYFKQFGDCYHKFIPKEVFSFSKEDLEILFQWLMWGDGHLCKNLNGAYEYKTTSKQLADDVQYLSLLTGRRARISYVQNQGNYGKNPGSYYIYRVYISSIKQEVQVNGNPKKNDKLIFYNGKVHCITLEKNHIFYVRRNGKCHWTGNSVMQGAKGVTSSVLSDSETPVLKDGTPVDVVLNSMSVVSRVAPSLLTTMALGKVAQKTNTPIKVNGFEDKSLVDIAQKALKDNNLTDIEDVYDPITGKHIKVFVGPLYFHRLHHISEDKMSARGQGGSYTLSMQPAKVIESDKAKKLGNLGTNVLLASNMKHFLEDAAVVRGTKNDEYWRALKLGLDLPTPQVPFVFHKFISHLEGAGVKVNQTGSKFNVLPQTNNDIKEMSKGAINNANIYKIKSGELIPEAGGLFDVDNTGITGENYNHINLKYPVINPITEDYIRKTLNLTKEKFEDLIGKGELIDKIKSIDMDKKIAELEKDLKSSKKTDRDNKLKVLAFLKNLKANKIDLKDLILDKIPVIPAKFRPLIIQGGRVISSGTNELYRDLMLTNQEIPEFMPDDLAQNIRKKQYDGVKAVYGLGEPISAKNKLKNFKGLLASALGLQGGSAKASMFQSQVVNKPVDLVGRAVLVPDANLDIDQVSLPQDMVWKIYSPFVIRRLVQSGLPATNAKEYVENKHPIALEHLNEELKDRPVTVSRDPQISKYSQQGFMVKMNPNPKDTTLKLNPLLDKGFSADHDGDQLNAYIPVSHEAKEEVKDKLLPSKNLLSPRNFTPMFIPSNESALGLYLSSTEKNNNPIQTFKTEQDVKDAYERGELSLGDRINIK